MFLLPDSFRHNTDPSIVFYVVGVLFLMTLGITYYLFRLRE